MLCNRAMSTAAQWAMLLLLAVQVLCFKPISAEQEAGTVIPAESRPCVDCHAFEFMQRALQDLKKTAFNLDSRTEDLVLRAEQRALCDCMPGTTLRWAKNFHYDRVWMPRLGTSPEHPGPTTTLMMLLPHLTKRLIHQHLSTAENPLTAIIPGLFCSGFDRSLRVSLLFLLALLKKNISFPATFPVYISCSLNANRIRPQ